MFLSRRDVLSGAAAVAATTAVVPPVFADAAKGPLGDKWAQIKAIVANGDPVLEQLLENLRHHVTGLKHPGGTPESAQNIATLMKVLIPVTAGIWNQLLVRKLLPVVAMTAPNDIINGREIEAVTRKLGAKWTMEAMPPQPPQHDVDWEAELLAALAHTVATEYNQEFFRYMRASAFARPVLPRDHSLEAAIRETAALMTPQGTWAVVSGTNLMTLGVNWKAHAENEPVMLIWPGAASTDGLWTSKPIHVYVDRYGRDDTPTLVGNETNDSLVFAPYVLIASSGIVIDPHSMEPVVSFLTRYNLAYTEKMRDHLVTIQHPPLYLS